MPRPPPDEANMRSAVKSSRSSSKKDKSPQSEVAAYIGSLSADSRREIKKLRAAIRAAAPGAVQGRSYGIVAFKLDGRVVVYFAGWKEHTSLYPLTAAMRRAHAAELKGYTTSKGTVRFPLDEPLPTAFVKRLVKTRLAEMRAKGKK